MYIFKSFQNKLFSLIFIIELKYKKKTQYCLPLQLVSFFLFYKQKINNIGEWQKITGDILKINFSYVINWVILD